MLDALRSFLAQRRVWLAPAVCVPIFALTTWFALALHFARGYQISGCIWSALFLGFLASGKQLFTTAAWWTWGYLALQGALLFVPISWYLWALAGFGVLYIAAMIALRAVFTWRAGAALLSMRRQSREA